ncbi:hypothetical protein ACS0TY_022109 [Phlomoides rotata]
MKLQRPDQRPFTYIKAQETKPALVVNLTEDEVSTRRAWRVWVCLTEMEKIVPAQFHDMSHYQIHQQHVDRNREYPTKSVQHDAQWKMARTYLQLMCHTREALFRKNFMIKKDRPGKEFRRKKSTSISEDRQDLKNL